MDRRAGVAYRELMKAPLLNLRNCPMSSERADAGDAHTQGPAGWLVGSLAGELPEQDQ